ncbi:MAG TPA: LacI family transcriptional regulator [Bacteroides sp.]|nr:LacI family transcriptional regulator [Bacteroides sp.]
MMVKKVTIKDIARELGTTTSTVSRAISNSDGISEKKRKQVLAKARAMGYEPNLFARQLRQGGSRTIGLIVPRINRVFFSNVIHGVEIIAREKGYSVIICQSHENKVREDENIKTLISNHVAGILMSVSMESEKADTHLEIQKRNIPFVMFDRVFEKLDANKVLNDNFHAARQLTEHLIEQGYGRIVHFAGPENINIYRERLRGFLAGLEKHGINPEKGQILGNVLTKEKGLEETNRLIETSYPFDAIFAASDYSALGALLSLKEHRIDVPGMVGVAGFANEPFTELLELTTVDQQSTEMGKTAARLLFEGIESMPDKTNKEIVIKPELIIRNSTLKTG